MSAAVDALCRLGDRSAGKLAYWLVGQERSDGVAHSHDLALGRSALLHPGGRRWTAIRDFDGLITPEERLRLAMARQYVATAKADNPALGTLATTLTPSGLHLLPL
jgi:hypothetical protein